MIRRLPLIVCALFVLAARYVPGIGEWYATHLYPYVSYLLSACSSIFPFSLEEWIVIFSLLFLFIYPIAGIVCHHKKWIIVRREVEVAVGVIVWFYMGWGCNYFRSNFYTRSAVTPVQTDAMQFKEYLTDYADSLNLYYVAEVTLREEDAEALIKEQFRQLPEAYGLCQPQDFQHPKYLVFNRLYSAVGVLGYMGPFMAESQLNLQLLPAQYPFTYAHELSHLLGISNEAEANYWAYYVCITSSDPQLKYCGYYNLLPYLINNARTVLPPDDYQAWLSRIDHRAINDLKEQSRFWQQQQINWINNLQESFYDWYLKSNQIPSGRANYNQVVQMIMSVRNKDLD